MIIEEMSAGECIVLIEAERVGRLGCSKDGRSYVVPLYYVSEEGRLYSFSKPGRKIDFMRANPHVCFEVENIAAGNTWKCVIVQGMFREYTVDEDRQRAWEILSIHNDWWEPGGRNVEPGGTSSSRAPIFFSISMDEVTGRRAVSE